MDANEASPGSQARSGEARFPGLAGRWQAESLRLARSGRGVFLFLVRAGAFAGLLHELAREASPCDLAEAADGAAGMLMPDLEPLEAERRALALHARLTALAGAPVTAAYGLIRRGPDQPLRGESAEGSALAGFFAKVLNVLDEGPQDGRLHRVREEAARDLGARVLAEEKRFLLFGAK
ncbi:MAG: hypothetical protein II595_07790 [Desulfovibrio sp.]|nr:hypothetical protein [Desulfovibrio sp.]